MARTKKTIDYNDPFPTRLRTCLDLAKDKGISAAEIAKAIDIKPQSISGWRNGESAPDFDNLVKIAKYFDVSIDWLLGQAGEDNLTADLSIQQMAEYTGLSSRAIESLHEWNTHEDFLAIHSKRWVKDLSSMIETDISLNSEYASEGDFCLISSLSDYIHYNCERLVIFTTKSIPGTLNNNLRDFEYVGDYADGDLYLADTNGRLRITSNILKKELWDDYADRVNRYSAEMNASLTINEGGEDNGEH